MFKFALRFFVFILCFTTTVFPVFSQKIMNLPAKYLKQHRGVSNDTNAIQIKSWSVYSDRPNNKTVTDLKSKAAFKTLDFLDKYYVTELVGDYIHIYKDESNSFLDQRLGPNAEDHGWINLNQV